MYFKSNEYFIWHSCLDTCRQQTADTGNGRFKYNWLASWVVQGLSYLSAQGALTRPFGQLPGVGDDRLIQTYSHAATPNGLILTSVPVSCVTVKQPPSVTSVKAFQPFPVYLCQGRMQITEDLSQIQPLHYSVSVTFYSGHEPLCL